jgi:glycosyltransferase involved in cell wall biosynthesis/Tfp pilus assembly protein PilF
VADAVDEIIIVDTGSVDRTIEIARSFGAQVIEREWTGSFSDARNASFDAATGDWILYLDADEVLVAEDAAKLRALTGRTWREAFYLVETNFTGDLSDGTAVTHNALRVFRNRPQYRFEGRLHEQIAQHLPGGLPERLEQTSIRVEHYGYLGAVRDAKEKSRRNIELLLAQQAESAKPTPFLHFNLGSEYAAAGDAPAALTEFEAAWRLIQEESHDGSAYEFTPSLISRLVKALRICGRPQAAIDRANEGLGLFDGFTDLVYEQATALVALNRGEEAVEYYERCVDMGDAPSRYTATVGCGTYLPRIALAELKLNRGQAEAARELLDWCMDNHPGFFGNVLPYATALLRCGVEPEAVAADVEQRVAELTPTVRFMLGTALFEAGAGEAAEEQYRLVLERQPHSAQARVALGEVLLYQRRYADAAVEAAALASDDPLASAACRTELFGRLAAGDHDGADRALDRARAVSLPAADLALFGGWADLARGQRPTRALPIPAIGLLGTVLEALLRVRDFTAFELLVVGLLRPSEAPEREQRELLAGMYLRQGFLKSAAEEWMAVCERAADARALVGLAQVAFAHGQPENAGTFAREALRMEPGNALARALAEAAPLAA